MRPFVSSCRHSEPMSAHSMGLGFGGHCCRIHRVSELGQPTRVDPVCILPLLPRCCFGGAPVCHEASPEPIGSQAAAGGTSRCSPRGDALYFPATRASETTDIHHFSE